MISLLFYFIIFESLLINLFISSGYNFLEKDSFVIVIILINSIITIILINGEKTQKNGVNNFNLLFSFAYIIRIITVFWDRYFRHIFILPNSGRDTGSFDNWAREFLSNNLSGRSGYAAVLGWIYKFFYPNPLWGQYLNVVASLLTIYVFYLIICKLNINQKYKKYGVLILCFLPNYIIMSSILLRESFITLLLAISIYRLIKWWESDKIYNLVFSIISALLASYLHSGVIAYVIAILIVVSFGDNKKKIFIMKFNTLFLFAIGSIFFLLIYVYLGETFFSYMGGINSIEDISSKSETYATGGSAYSVYLVDDDSILGFIINSPLRIIYFLASPLPWDWRGINDIIAFLGSSLFYTISIFFGIKSLSIKKFKNKDLVIILLIIAISNAIIYSWGVSNAGTALRHRDKFIVNFALLLIISLDVMYMPKEIGEKIEEKKNS